MQEGKVQPHRWSCLPRGISSPPRLLSSKGVLQCYSIDESGKGASTRIRRQTEFQECRACASSDSPVPQRCPALFPFTTRKLNPASEMQSTYITSNTSRDRGIHTIPHIHLMANQSVVELDLPAPLLSELKEVFGCFLLGTVLSAIVYGISVLQAYVYFRNGGQDSKYLRCFVAFIFTLDTLAMVLNCEGLYEYVVQDFGDLLSLLKLPWATVLLHALIILTETLTQCFFAYRLWTLSKHNMLLVSSIVVLSLGSCAPGIVSFVIICKSTEVFALHTPQLRTLWGSSSGLNMVCDILIVTGLCYYLHSKRTGFKGTDSIIDRLIIYAINRGVLTAMCQAAWLITCFALPDRFLDIPFGLLDQHLYCNTLLATLNAQRSLGRSGNNVVELLNTQQLAGTSIPALSRGHRNSGRTSRDPESLEQEPSETSGDSGSTIQVVIDIAADKTTEAANVLAA